MKARILSLVAVFAVVAQMATGQNYRVEAINDDISYNLDLKAVASVFGEANNLEDFERRLNDSENQISNLDLNNDGMIDYLRVVEVPERNVTLVVVQAVLDRDVYQDVATIVLEQEKQREVYVQIIGAPFIYGANYIIEPRFYRIPRIVRWFYSPYYSTWHSPYYWGYYPNYYRHHRTISINLYLSNTYRFTNHRHHYRYSNSWRNQNAYQTYQHMSRNDYGTRYPERSYSSRNSNFENRYHMDKHRNTGYTYGSGRTEKSNSRSEGSYTRNSSQNSSVNRDNSRYSNQSNSGSQRNTNSSVNNDRTSSSSSRESTKTEQRERSSSNRERVKSRSAENKSNDNSKSTKSSSRSSEPSSRSSQGRR